MQVATRVSSRSVEPVEQLHALAVDGRRTAWDEMERALYTLRAIHLRVTLMRLVLPRGLGDGAAMARRVAADVSHSSIMCCVPGEGEVLALYVGPRAASRVGDQTVAETMTRHLFQAMWAAGMEISADWAEVALQHGWTDGIVDLRCWLAELSVGPDKVA